MTTVAALQRVEFPRFERDGVLTEFSPGPAGVPFEVRRVFTISGVSTGGVRGDHAHRRCTQMLVCLMGEITVVTHDGAESVTDTLVPDGRALVIPPMLWNGETFRDPSSVLAVFCDQRYDEDEYIRSWETYLRLKAREVGDPAGARGPT